MISHFNHIMTSLTFTMLILLIFILIQPTVNYEEQLNNRPQTMIETKYFQNLELKPTDTSVVIYPLFTQGAYEWGGFHDFLTGRCDDCLTIKIPTFFEKFYSSSGNGYAVLELLGYNVITDLDVTKNPSILKNYDKVILLHNEFVTYEEFQAIIAHPKVIYLYPGALSSQVKIDANHTKMTLLKSNGYPDPDISNAFEWENDNTKFFYDDTCDDWHFYKVTNGYMLNCYPEFFIIQDGYELLKKLRDL